jgi:zinc protease
MIAHLAALVVALNTPSAGPAATPEPPRLAVEAYKLPNGLKVALHRDASVPRVTVCVAYHVGARNERAGRTGFAHFFEHMMFRGTKNVPNYDIPLKETGAQSNAFTTEDMTVYFETVPSNYLERALYLEAERLAFLPTALNQAAFDTEREVVKNERRLRHENVPYGLAEETILANVFPKGHPYSWSVIGSMKDLDAATLDDLRRFFAEFYHPANATLCLAGDFDPARAKGLVEKYFGPLVAGPTPRKLAPGEAPTVERRVTQADEVQLPRIHWAWPTVADDHDDAPALDILASVLAGGDASRLHKALVLEARAAKDVAADSDTKEISGLFTIQSTAAEGKGVAEIESILAAQLDRLRSEPPTADELARALAKVEKAFYHGLTSPLGRAVMLSNGFAQKDDPNYYRRDFARYFRVTPADLARVAQRYLTPMKVVLDIEPARPGQKETEAVQAGPGPASRSDDAPLPDRTPRGGPDWSKLPGPGEPAAFRAPKVVRKRLGNGLDVWISPWRTLPLVEARLIVPAGTADDPAGKSGLATLTATLLDKGSTRLTATELAEALERLGASVGIGAGPDDTIVRVDLLARELERPLALVAEMLTSPRFDPKDVDRERQLQLADLLQGPDNPHWIAGRAFRAVLHGKGHPYANPSDGYPETVKRLTGDDVRAFHKGHFAPNVSTLIVVGDVDPEALVATLEKTLGTWTGQAEPPRPRPEAKAGASPRIAYLVDKPGAVQSVLTVGRRWVERVDPRYYATLIGNHILGADFLSRLNRNLRVENGFTYGAGSAFVFRRTGSVWAVQTDVRAEVTAAALKEVLGELDALTKDKPFTTEEIGVAREAEVRSYPESFESPGGIVGTLEEMAEFHLPPDYLETYLERLQSTKPDQIVRAMTEVVEPKERVVLVVGDRASVEPKLKALGFREVRLVTPDGEPAAK